LIVDGIFQTNTSPKVPVASCPPYIKTLSPSVALTCPHLAMPQLVLLVLNSIVGYFSIIEDEDGVIFISLAFSFLEELLIISFKGLSLLRSHFSISIY
jgi:hypothetical protein